MYIRNLRAWFALATPDEIAEGREWYRDARRFVTRTARRYDIPARKVAAVTAAVSPNCSWPDNKVAAEAIIAAYHAGIRNPDGIRPPGVYPANIAKALTILSGPATPHVCDGTRVGKSGATVGCAGKSHGCDASLHGPKVAEFYATIMGKRDGRVMDVWATRAADVHPSRVATLAADDPDRDGLPGARLPMLQSAYSVAANHAGLDAADFQAVVWIVIRNRWLRSDGARNGVRRDIAA